MQMRLRAASQAADGTKHRLRSSQIVLFLVVVLVIENMVNGGRERERRRGRKICGKTCENFR